MEHNMVAMSGHDVYKSTLSRLKPGRRVYIVEMNRYIRLTLNKLRILTAKTLLKFHFILSGDSYFDLN